MKGKIKGQRVTHDQVRAALDYNPVTGNFVWKIAPARNVKVGDIAGSNNDDRGYRYIKVGGEEVTAARLAWFYMTGEWPRTRVQFKNRDPSDCRFENLTLSNGLLGEFDFKTREGNIEYCRAYRKANPEKEKGRALRDSFGMDLAAYSRMLLAQDGKCAICDRPETQTRGGRIKALAVDHNHETGQIRGLLCSDCNQAIGKFRENPDILLRAIKYLRSYSDKENNVISLKENT